MLLTKVNVNSTRRLLFRLGPKSQGYKVFYTTNPGLPIASWDSQVVDHSQLTTISDLTPHTIYTIRVQAETSVGSGPLSTPVQVKTQHGVPSQPTGLRAIDVSATSVSLEWARPHHTGENVNSYELYWNDTFTKVNSWNARMEDVEQRGGGRGEGRIEILKKLTNRWLTENSTGETSSIVTRQWDLRS